MRHHKGKLLAAAVIAVSLLGEAISPVVADAAPLYDNTNLGSFFNVSQAKLDRAPNGQLMGVRQVPNTINPGSRILQYTFKTTNSHGKAVLGSAAVSQPMAITPNSNVVVYNDFINSLGVQCQPSFGYAAAAHFISRGGQGKGTTRDRQIMTRNGVVYLLTSLGNAAGLTMIFPDFLGMNSSYTANRLGGHITLDSMRAAKQIRRLNIRHSQFALSGYSGGAMVAGFAAAQAPTYAPELNIKGLAIGGTPTDMVWMGRAFGNNAHPGFGLGMAALIGMEREYPNRTNFTNRLNEHGRKLAVANRNSCAQELIANMANESIKSTTTGVDLNREQATFKVFEENSLLYYRPVPKAMPMYIWGSSTDTLVPISKMEKVAKRWCRARPGMRIELVDTHVPNHVANASVGAWPAFIWIMQRFAGVPAPNNLC